MAQAKTTSRPYWHVDLKWVSGILLTFSLASTLFLLSAYQVTSRQIATQITTNVLIQLLTNPNDSQQPGQPKPDQAAQDAQLKADLKAKIAASPTKSFQPFPGLNVTITQQDIDTLTADQLKQKAFHQITDPIYDLGVKGYAAKYIVPDQQEQFIKQASVLDVVTAERHRQLGGAAAPPLVASLIFLAGLVFFSAGAGRLVSPAVVFIMVSFVPAVLLSVISVAAPQNGSDTHPGLFGLPSSATLPIVKTLQRVYLFPFLVGLALLVAAVVVKQLAKRRHG